MQRGSRGSAKLAVEQAEQRVDKIRGWNRPLDIEAANSRSPQEMRMDGANPPPMTRTLTMTALRRDAEDVDDPLRTR